ncbi:ankyrin repeat domain-containing protein 26-like [Phycodurus eques]|uniref:ankyrin repeat domain-containing protein 26-like n=1 Tax=Phycodurus eques TaxID=693459 RepID=UPI002ACDFEAA|nr:ankyrin repeat domain-containing protein 26-like [Phycodurus eques]
MKKLFKFPKRKTSSIDAVDSASIASDLRENEMGKFHKAAWQNDMAKLEQLVKIVDVNQIDKQNRTALHVACARGNVEVVKFLIEKNAQINLCDNQNRSALMKAVQEQRELCANILLENKADPNLMDSDGNTVLHLASSIPLISTVILLVKHDADINAKNLEGISPLTVAVQEDHIEVAEYLLKKGANVNILDRHRRSPLMMAAGNGHIDMTRLLLQFKANVELTDSKGQSATDYAEMEYHDHCSLLIAEHRKKQAASIQIHSSPSKNQSKSFERTSSKDAVSLDRVSSASARKEDPTQKECDMSQLFKILTQLGKDKNEKFDLEEIGSDCDKTSNASKITLPEGSLVSQISEEFPECSTSSMEVREVEVHPKGPGRNISDVMHLSPQTKLHSKKPFLESDKSDYDQDIMFVSCYDAKTEDRRRKGVVGPGSPCASIMSRDIRSQLQSDTPVGRKQKGRKTEWSFQAAKDAAQIVSMKNLSTTSDIGGRGSDGHASEKTESSMSRKESSLRSKDMSTQPETPLHSKKQAPSAGRPLGESPVSHQRFSIANKPDDQTVEKISQLAVVSKTRPAKVLPSSRDLAVNDDSTLSDVSDDEGRWQAKQKPKKQRIDEMEISEELDEITSSSDLTLDECELPPPTHQGTSFIPANLSPSERPFKMKLDGFMGQQNKLPILKPKEHHSCAGKMTKLKTEKAELKNKIEEVKDDQCAMEHKQMQMESEITNLRLSTKQQQEDCLNTIRMAHINNEKLEEELRQAHVQLSQERCTNAQLQQKLKSQDCKQHTIEEDYKRIKHNEEHLRTELEVTQTHSSTKQRDLAEENEALKEQLEDIRQDLRLTNDNQAQSVLEWNNMITGLKCEVTLANARLEAQYQAHNVLEAETQAVRARLAEAEQLRSEMEKTLLQEKEEQQRLRDKLASEIASQREAVAKLSQKLAKAKAHGNTMENEVHRVEAQLIEKNAQIATLQREMDLIKAHVKELEALLQTEKDLVSWAGARQEATQELLGQAQSEGILVRQKLEEAQKQCVAKELAVTDAQKCFTEILAKLRSDCEGRVQLVQDRNQDLATKAAELREHIHQLQEEKNEREACLRQLQAELADSLKKLSKCEASLEVYMRYRSESEEEKTRLHKEADRFKRKMEEKESHCIQAEKQVTDLRSRLDEREQQLIIAAQKQKEALSVAAATNISVKQLEEAVYRLKALLKGAKKKLQDYRASEIEREKANELQAELNRQMSFRSLLEKNKKQLEEEVQSLRRRMETNMVEQKHVEQYRREIEEKARQEIQKKIHEVNLFLQSQAATQEAQDQIKATTEVSLRSKIQELEGELKRARSIQHDTIAQRDALHKELKRYRQMHREEQWLRKSLSNDLKRTNSRLTEANSKLLSERCKSLVASGTPGTTGPLPSTSGTMAAPYRMRNSRILNPVAEGQGSNVEDYLSKR